MANDVAIQAGAITAIAIGSITFLSYMGYKLWKAGIFSKLMVQEVTLGPYLLLYRQHTVRRAWEST